MKFIELFAGIGGFRYGLEQASDKFKIVWANEIDRYAAQIYRKNYGEGELYEGDITKIETGLIPDHDLLCAGFPCQAFSIAGRRLGFGDIRGTLFFQICRIAKAKRTPLLLLENVKGLLNHERGSTFQTILASLDELGYDLQWQVLNSKNFGVPQNRERVFIVGHLRGTSRPEVFPVGGTNCKVDGAVYPCLTPDRPIKRQNGQRFKAAGEPMFTLTGQDKHGILFKPLTRQGINGIIKEKGGSYASTQEANTYKILPKTLSHLPQQIAQNARIRRLTPVEAERLQGFPDGWTEKGLTLDGNCVNISDTQRYKVLGNAVTTNVIKEIGCQLAKCQQIKK